MRHSQMSGWLYGETCACISDERCGPKDTLLCWEPCGNYG